MIGSCRCVFGIYYFCRLSGMKDRKLAPAGCKLQDERGWSDCGAQVGPRVVEGINDGRES